MADEAPGFEQWMASNADVIIMQILCVIKTLLMTRLSRRSKSKYVRIILFQQMMMLFMPQESFRQIKFAQHPTLVSIMEAEKAKWIFNI